MKKIAVGNSKGGVAKTTTVTNLGFGLAKKGARVLLVDCDTQGQVATMLGVKTSKGLADLFLETLDHKAALRIARDNLVILAGDRRLAKAKSIIMQQPMRQEYTLTDLLQPYEEMFDFVILDTSPGWDVLTINALVYVDEILSPVSVEGMGIDGLLKFRESIQPIEEAYETKLRFILPTFMDGRVAQSEHALDTLQEHFGDLLCEPIRYSVKLSEAATAGKSIFEYSSRNRGALDYAKLLEEVMNG